MVKVALDGIRFMELVIILSEFTVKVQATAAVLPIGTQ